jgi:hypothetical protein
MTSTPFITKIDHPENVLQDAVPANPPPDITLNKKKILLVFINPIHKNDPAGRLLHSLPVSSLQ